MALSVVGKGRTPPDRMSRRYSIAPDAVFATYANKLPSGDRAMVELLNPISGITEPRARGASAGKSIVACTSPAAVRSGGSGEASQACHPEDPEEHSNHERAAGPPKA